jgi:Xaa-Pro aminopeptidase
MVRKYPATHRGKKSNPILQRRSVKESEELDLIQQACTITEKDSEEFFLQKPNVIEYEIEEFIHEFTLQLSPKVLQHHYWLRKQC